MEQDDDNESTKSEVKLGKLQFQLDYDFTKNEVGHNPAALIPPTAMPRRSRTMSAITLGVKKTSVPLDLKFVWNALTRGNFCFNLIYDIKKIRIIFIPTNITEAKWIYFWEGGGGGLKILEARSFFNSCFSMIIQTSGLHVKKCWRKHSLE